MACRSTGRENFGDPIHGCKCWKCRRKLARAGHRAGSSRRCVPMADDDVAVSKRPGTTRRTSRKPTPTPMPTEAVKYEWLRRVEAEYRSAARTQHLTLWLIQIGASPDLVRAGLRIAGDEIVHAEMSHRVFLAAGGEGSPQ